MDVLFIEENAHRRVSVARHLMQAGHRVTIGSSIEEAREILQFITIASEVPDAVVIGESLLSADSASFREEIGERFPQAVWVPLPPHLSPDWLSGWLQKARNAASFYVLVQPSGFVGDAAQGFEGN